jgi:hypothetical protein
MQQDRSPSSRTAPAPLLRSFDQPCTHRIPFDVTTDRQHILSGFDGKGLEASLIDMPFSYAVSMLMPPLRMREGQPIHEARKIPVLSGPDDEMPVIRHDTVGQESHCCSRTGLNQHPFKRRIIAIVIEQRPAGIRSVQDVVDDVGGAALNGRPMLDSQLTTINSNNGS